jgi:hypothetical protein
MQGIYQDESPTSRPSSRCGSLIRRDVNPDQANAALVMLPFLIDEKSTRPCSRGGSLVLQEVSPGQNLHDIGDTTTPKGAEVDAAKMASDGEFHSISEQRYCNYRSLRRSLD